jgi:hypothetical protein
MPIIAGLLATSSVWSPETFGENVEIALAALPSSRAKNDQHLDLGCSLQHGAFEQIPKPHPREARPSGRAFEARQNGALLQTARQSPRSSPEPRPSGRALSSKTATVSKPSTRGRTGNRFSTSTPDESLIFFILRLLQRLREMGTAPAADLMEYGRSLRSFRK